MVHEDEQKPGFAQFLKMRRVLVVNILLFALMGWAFANQFVTNHDLAKQVVAMSSSADELQHVYEADQQKTQILAGAGAAEREARLKLNLQKPGEEVVVLRGMSDSQAQNGEVEPRTKPAQPTEPRGNALGWWHYFFK